MNTSNGNRNVSFSASAQRKQKYKDLLEIGGEAAKNQESNSVVDNLTIVTDLITQSDDLFKQGDNNGVSSESVLDAQVVKLAHDIMNKAVQKIEGDTFSDDSFAAALLNRVKDEKNESDWSKLDEMVCKMSRRFRYSTSMFGQLEFDEPLETEPTQSQKQRRTRQKKDIGELRRPLAMPRQAEVNTDKGNSKVDAVLNIIKDVYEKNGQQAIPFYKLVIDPSNMMYTFDNSFQLSFLFRDGFISFEKDAEGLPAIRPTNRNKESEMSMEMVSFVSSLNNRIIQKYIKKYNIREAMLKIERNDKID